MRYQLVSRDRKEKDWQLGEFILSGSEFDEVLHHLIQSTPISHITYEGRPVFMKLLGKTNVLFIAFKIIQ
jgi:hypothetical protein